MASRGLGGTVLHYSYSATGRGKNGTSVVAAPLEVGRGLVNALLALGEAIEGFEQVRRFGLVALDHFAVGLRAIVDSHLE